MSEEEQYPQRKERQEKQEKQQEEKNWEEKWRRDPLNAGAWAIIIIWGGLVLLAGNLKLLDWITFLEPWSIFFLGAGTILLLEVGLRLLLPTYRQPVLGTAILAAVFLAIGLGEVVKWQCLLPAAVIAVGFYLLFSSVFRRRE